MSSWLSCGPWWAAGRQRKWPSASRPPEQPTTFSGRLDLARRMVAQFGMSSRFGPMALATVQNEYLEGQSYMDCSQTTAAQMDQEVQSILAQVLADAKKLLSDHRNLLDEVALYLLTKETITGDELMRYVNANQTAQPATVSQDPAED